MKVDQMKIQGRMLPECKCTKYLLYQTFHLHITQVKLLDMNCYQK